MEEKYIKLFDEWNHFKKILNSIEIPIPFHEGEIWSVALGVNMGIEIDGKGSNFERPALIVKKFNKKHAWILPFTSTEVVKVGIHIPIYNVGFEVNSSVIITQLQRISSRRLMWRMSILDQVQFFKIIDRIREVLSNMQERSNRS